MIQILKDKFIIEVSTDYPADEVSYVKFAILKAIEDISWQSENMNDGTPLSYLHSLAKLAQEMDYDPEVLYGSFGLNKRGKWDEEKPITALQEDSELKEEFVELIEEATSKVNIVLNDYKSGFWTKDKVCCMIDDIWTETKPKLMQIADEARQQQEEHEGLVMIIESNKRLIKSLKEEAERLKKQITKTV